MMSEENNNVEQQQEQAPQENMFSEDQVRGMISEAIQNEVSGLKSKNQELLGKLKAKDNEMKEDALKRSGDLDELKAFYNDRIKEIEADYNDKVAGLQTAVQERDKADVIAKLAGEFVDSEAGSFMLKNMVEVKDGNQMFRDFSGNVIADNIADFKQWMATNPHMSHLVRGTKATGGGANGGVGKANNPDKTMSRSDFLGMDPSKQMDFMKKGGQVTD